MVTVNSEFPYSSSATASGLALSNLALDDKQAGHVRRIFNLANQLPDDWSGMMARSTMQEDFGALRFQLAYMAFALGLTHVHRLPAAPGYFKKPFDQLIQKMLSPDVWTYWHYVSTGNSPRLNASLGELPAQWDPVIKDNIMYSAYVQAMALLYHYLFRDGKYAEPGALTFRLRPLYWGQTKNFVYDEKSLNDHIYWSMVENGYLGVACEPNCIFQICNQVPLLGFRFHDLVYGTTLAKEATAGYLKAWADFGITTDQGHFNMMVQEHERVVLTPDEQPWVDFWLGSLMHAWNPDFIKQYYPRQMARWSKPGPEGSLWIRPQTIFEPDLQYLMSARDFGWGAIYASEVGDTDTLVRLLDYADDYLNPQWQDGAYYFARQDQAYDGDGRFTVMDPHTGNALLAYARLNVPDGLRKLYETPLTNAHFNAPTIAELDYRVDLRAARYDADANCLTIALKAADAHTPIVLSNVWGRGAWRLELDGQTVASGDTGKVQTAGTIDARRDGDQMLFNFPSSRLTTAKLYWL